MAKILLAYILTGSLSDGDFNPESSDIDLITIVKKSLSRGDLKAIKKLHLQIANNYKKWAKRLECSYTPVKMFKNILPPKLPRPYFGAGTFYPKARYGNEWLINNYLLYKHSVALIGPDFRKLVQPIDMLDVQKACVRDLFKEWQPKITDSIYFQDSHHQSYIVLNMCRILYTVMRKSIASKKVSADWVKNEFAPQWKNLIQKAENWKYGTKMNLEKEVIEFIKFTINEVKEK